MLVRWALHSEAASRRDGLWKFAARTSREPATDDVVHACFGMGFADLRDHMSDYLPRAVATAFPVQIDPAPALPAASPRDATIDEVGRLKGDWERLVYGYVKRRHADFLWAYEAEAERTLMSAYSRGARDPRLLSVLGLYHADRGNTAEARTYLEAAAETSSSRPRVYLELARQRYLAARAHPLGGSGRFSAPQADGILAPLAIAQKHSPPLPETFDLAGIVWLNTEGSIGPAQWSLFERGRELFPEHLPLLFQLASLRARHGHRHEAEILIREALGLNPSPALREAFLELQKHLVENSTGPTGTK